MKKIAAIAFWTVLVFIFLTWSTAKIETPIDGHDTYGFPLTFHTQFSGMCDPCPENPTKTNYWNLLLDIAIAAGAGFIIWKIIRVVTQRPQ
jgi:hypothetical protein